MPEEGGVRRARGARPHPGDSRDASVERGTDALILPRAAEQWVSAEAIRRLIGAWAYGALAEADRPGSADVRRAVGIGCAVAELALEDGRSPFSARVELPLWEIDVEVPAARLGELAGYADRDAVAGVDLLRRSGAVLTTDERGTRVRLAEAVCAPLPGAAGVSWGAARAALQALGVAVGAMAAPLAVLREVAQASGPVPDPAAAPHVRYSVRELEAATLFSRSTVSETLALLERAGLLATEARRGQTLRCALTPRAFGVATRGGAAGQRAHQMSAVPGAPVSETGTAPATEASGATKAPASIATVQADGGQVPSGVVRLGEFAGTPIYAPVGTPISVATDAAGRWICRVGPLVLGPVD